MTSFDDGQFYFLGDGHLWQFNRKAAPQGVSKKDKPKRCVDCDSDCWDVINKLNCWLYKPETDHCPWVHLDVPLPSE